VEIIIDGRNIIKFRYQDNCAVSERCCRISIQRPPKSTDLHSAWENRGNRTVIKLRKKAGARITISKEKNTYRIIFEGIDSKGFCRSGMHLPEKLTIYTDSRGRVAGCSWGT